MLIDNVKYGKNNYLFFCFFLSTVDTSSGDAATADSIHVADGTVTETVFTSDDVPDFKVEPNQYDSVYPYQVCTLIFFPNFRILATE